MGLSFLGNLDLIFQVCFKILSGFHTKEINYDAEYASLIDNSDWLIKCI